MNICTCEDISCLVEQIICARSNKFIGNELSTVSSYIYRLRLYMSDVIDKSYYINNDTSLDIIKPSHRWYENWGGNHLTWAKDFIDAVIFEETIT
jgi:endo-beta-N-acetylglucosaminidase D